MVGFPEINSVVLVLTSLFTGVANDLLSVFIAVSAILLEAESEKSTIFFLSQRYCFVS